MYLEQLLKEYAGYKVGYRHNPEHFYPKSFGVEIQERRLIIVAVAKRHIGKKFKIVGVLKRIH